jgi:hypothetical protein
VKSHEKFRKLDINRSQKKEELWNFIVMKKQKNQKLLTLVH